MNRFYLIIFLLLATIINADAKNCKTGKPCGNSCIDKDKVCHSDESSSFRSSSSATTHSYSGELQITYECNGILVSEREYKNCKPEQHASNEREELAEADNKTTRQKKHLVYTR